eukprot:293480-Chlamydomonas_euryale.AAC.1
MRAAHHAARRRWRHPRAHGAAAVVPEVDERARRRRGTTMLIACRCPDAPVRRSGGRAAVAVARTCSAPAWRRCCRPAGRDAPHRPEPHVAHCLVDPVLAVLANVEEKLRVGRGE